MSIKVLFVADSLRIGGSEHVLIEILRRLDRARFESHLALLTLDGGLVDRVPGDVALHPLNLHHARMASLPLARLCWKLRPQAVLSFAAHVNSAVILARPLMPAGTRILAREGANVTLPEVAGPAHRSLYKRLYPHADVVICQSDDMVQRMRRCFGIPEHKLIRIYNPVDAPELQEAAARRPSPYHGPGPHLAAVASLIPVKGTDLLIEAMPAVLDIHPTADLTLIGDGPLEGALRRLVKTVAVGKMVSFVGAQPNPFPFIRYADLLVISSRSEALPNAALEALALGTPVVATDCPGGIREIAKRTKRLFLAAKIEAGALALAINAALTCMLGRCAQRTVEAEFLREFSPERIIPLYEHVIERTVGTLACASMMQRQEVLTR
jgi:glycosyltransferase involved in cell wall biosynthesis